MTNNKPNVLAVIAHPNPQSFNYGLLEETKAACEQAGAKLTVKDLYAESFNPVMSPSDFQAAFGGPIADDVAKEQAAVCAADVLVIHYPVFWFDRPAILKGWFDRVFTMGFAYTYKEDGSGTEGLMKGKKSRVIQTTATSLEFYERFGAASYPHMGIKAGTLAFCGFDSDVLTHYTAMTADEENRERMKAETRRFVLDSVVDVHHSSSRVLRS